jgi:Ser/Thr protein kinase RdoA (MazF antagonist)
LRWISEIEQLRLQALVVCIHGDLHAGNVLMNVGNRPLLIDIGDVGLGASAIDPIMLELSPLFHPAGEKLRGEWPSAENIAGWPRIDAFAA